jgi:hypothetical protein
VPVCRVPGPIIFGVNGVVPLIRVYQVRQDLLEWIVRSASAVLYGLLLMVAVGMAFAGIYVLRS